MTLPVFGVGQTIVIEERWQGMLWSAVPAIVVRSQTEELVSYAPAGSISVLATNRELPQSQGLGRSERKLVAMKTCVAQAAEVAETPTKLYVHRPARWSRVNLGWDPDDGRFLGWYVNFERPPVGTPAGVESKDLVLDLFVNPDRSWAWKDRADFAAAITAGVLSEELRPTLEREADLVLRELEAGTGPFADELPTFTAPASWTAPDLPAEYRQGGPQWTLPPGRRVVR